MSNKKVLAEEARELLLEFRDLTILIGESISDIHITEDYEIELELCYEEAKVLDLKNISSYVNLEMNGIGPCPAWFYDAIEALRDQIKDEYENYTEEVFNEKIDEVDYLEKRSEDILKRLKEIEKEVL